MVSRDLFVFFFALQSFGANAQTKTVLSGAEIYGRCYAQFTGKPVPLKSSVLTAIQSGRISALSACEVLLQTAELAALNGRLLNEDETSRAVLKRFYDFHRSWFAAGVVEQIQDHSTENSRGIIDVYDTTEPALALTRAAFAQGVKYGMGPGR